MPGIGSHPSYTVAFGEVVCYDDDGFSDTVLTLLTSPGNFPSLQPSTAVDKVIQEDREWQLVRPEDADINEGLTTSLGVDVKSDDSKSDMGSVGWERLDFQKPLSFSEIASKAKDNAPIPNERFFMRSKQPKKRTKKSAMEEPNTPLPLQENTPIDDCDPFYNCHNVIKEGRRIISTRRHFALRRKRITLESVLSRRTQTIPEIVARHTERQERAKTLFKEVQEKHDTTFRRCCWFYSDLDLGWCTFNESQRAKSKGTKKAKLKTKEEYIRKQVIDELKLHGLFTLPSGKDIVTYDDEEQAIVSFVDMAKCHICPVFFKDIGDRRNYSKLWAYYIRVLHLFRHYIVPKYQAMLNWLGADAGHPGDKSLMRILYKQLPRKYYTVDNRKRRKQHVLYFMQSESEPVKAQ